MMKANKNQNGSKQKLGYDLDSFFEQAQSRTSKQIARDIATYKDFFYSGLSQADYAREHGITPRVLQMIRERYGLPRQPLDLRSQRKLAKREYKLEMICKHDDCMLCNFMARVWRVDRKIDADADTQANEVVQQ